MQPLSKAGAHHVHVFNVTHLFSNAEVFEYDVQDLLRSDPSSDPTKAGKSQPDALSCQSQVNVTVLLVLSQGRKTLLQMCPVAGLGQGGGTGQRVATTREEVSEQYEPMKVSILGFIQYFCRQKKKKARPVTALWFNVWDIT